MKNRYEFVLLFDVKNGNPNGDPDAGNSPRTDPQDLRGFVSDGCIKRKIRDFVSLAKASAPGFEIFVSKGAALSEAIQAAHDKLGHDVVAKNNKKKATREQVSAARDEMCKKFWDVRTFGAVMGIGANAGQVRGPIQILVSKSVDPILDLELSITRMAVADAKELSGPNQTMGRKHIVPYGLYVCHGFVNANLANETGFTDEDLELLWQALINLFEHDRSAGRGLMSTRRLIVFKHASLMGNAPAHRLFERVVAKLKSGVTIPRDYSDYEVTVDTSSLKGVEVIEMV